MDVIGLIRALNTEPILFQPTDIFRYQTKPHCAIMELLMRYMYAETNGHATYPPLYQEKLWLTVSLEKYGIY